MSSVPLWVPLVVAALGFLGTVGAGLGGVLITQRRSDRREGLAWQRERERERQQWKREDALRTFEHRREAYVTYYRELVEQETRLNDHALSTVEDRRQAAVHISDDWGVDLQAALQELHIRDAAGGRGGGCLLPSPHGPVRSRPLLRGGGGWVLVD